MLCVTGVTILNIYVSIMPIKCFYLSVNLLLKAQSNKIKLTINIKAIICHLTQTYF